MRPGQPGHAAVTAPRRLGWSWTIGFPFGVRLRIHATFALLLAWIIASNALNGEGASATVRAVVMTLTLFGIVVLHELGHVLAARRYGIVTRDITLLPIGGVASMERLPDDPRQELVVAIAGPAVNFVLAGLFAAAAMVFGVSLDPQVLIEQPSWLGQMFWANVVLALFNLVPAFPMDGGRVLRALLAMKMGADRATSIAARLGQSLAITAGFIGLFTSPVLVFVALFVWMGAAAEASAVHIRAAIAGLHVRDVMATPVLTLAAEANLGAAVEACAHGFQSEFPVVEQGRVVGWLGLRELVAGLTGGAQAQPLRLAMRPCEGSASPDERLEDVLHRMERDGARAVAVLAFDRVVGVLTLEHLGEFVAIRDAQRHIPSGIKVTEGRWHAPSRPSSSGVDRYEPATRS